MQTQTRINDRTRSLRDLLSHHRTLALTRVREYRSAQEADASPPPGDELDTARALAEVETYASLIERAEERLRAIDFAFNLLERHRYGTCAQCGEEIPAERLKVVPFAAYCVDCQQKRDHVRHIGEGTVDEPFAHQWALPPEMAESTEESHDELVSSSQERPAETEERPRVVGRIVESRESQGIQGHNPRRQKASATQMSLAGAVGARPLVETGANRDTRGDTVVITRRRAAANR